MTTSCSYGVTGTSVSNPSAIKSTYHAIDAFEHGNELINAFFLKYPTEIEGIFFF